MSAQFFENRVIRILVAQFIQGELQLFEDGNRCSNSGLIAFEKLHHVSAGFQMPFCIRLQRRADCGQCLALANTAQDILQGATLRRVVKHIANRQKWQFASQGHARQAL